MRIREDLSGISSWIMGARSAYVLNQSKSPSDSLVKSVSRDRRPADATTLTASIFDS